MGEIKMIKQSLIVLSICLMGAGGSDAQSSERPQASHRIEKNVVYGMYSGLALLMDVHYPEKPNGYGIIHIAGSGWTAPLSVDARQLKHSDHLKHEAWPMLKAGYTVFTINHRAAPRFRFPAPLEDAQRAVRLIRSRADQYGIDPDRIGAIGGSSGGHLVSMLALQDGKGDPEAPNPINRLSAKVQCVVARAVRVRMSSGRSSQLLLGYRIMPRHGEESEEHRTAREASPFTYVTADDPPTLLLHGEVDQIISIQGARDLKAALEKVGVPVELIEVKGGGHGTGFTGTDQDINEIYLRAVHWMDKYLKTEK